MSPPINRAWLFSNGAGRLYFVSSLAGIAFFILLFAIEIRIGSMGALTLNPWVLVILQIIFYIGALGLSILWMAMWLCMLNFEKESIAGSIYLPLFILLGLFGTLIYYFARYRKLLITQSKAVVVSA